MIHLLPSFLIPPDEASPAQKTFLMTNDKFPDFFIFQANYPYISFVMHYLTIYIAMSMEYILIKLINFDSEKS
jgi:hypothetical protein